MSEKQVKRNRRAHGIKWDGWTFVAPFRMVSREYIAEAIYNVEPTQVPMCADPECELCGGQCFYGSEGE